MENCTVCTVWGIVQFVLCGELYSLYCVGNCTVCTVWRIVQFVLCGELYSLYCVENCTVCTVSSCISSKLNVVLKDQKDEHHTTALYTPLLNTHYYMEQ